MRIRTDHCTDYVSQQKYIENLGVGAAEYNNNYVGIASYNIFVGVAIATIFGAAFFFDLFWPERYESPGVKLAWKISAVFVCCAALGDALAYTVSISPNTSRDFLEAMTSVLIRSLFICQR